MKRNLTKVTHTLDIVGQDRQCNKIQLAIYQVTLGNKTDV